MWKVLVVEDDPMLAQIHKNYIESQKGFECVEIAHNTTSALEAIKKHTPDLIFLDVYLPEMTGIDFLINLRKMGNDVDVILITASREFEKIEKAFHYGAMDYLIKPFEFERLQKSLDVFVQRKTIHVNVNEIDQSKVDDYFVGQSYEDDIKEVSLPKGLHGMTLERVRKVIADSIEPSTIEEIATKVDISKVAVRKYLMYLKDLEEIDVEMAYGSRGRPSYLYKKKNKRKY